MFLKARIFLVAVAFLLAGAAPVPKTDIEGDLEVIAIDYYPSRVEYEYHVKDIKGVRHRIKMPVSYKHGEGNLKSGHKVKARGTKVKTPKSALSPSTEALAIESLEVTAQAVTVIPNTLGVHKILVFSVNYSNQGGPTTPTSARSFMQGVIKPFYQESSYGRFGYGGSLGPTDVADFIEVTLSIPSGNCDVFAITEEARAQALKAGYPTDQYPDFGFRGYHHFLYLIPYSPCGWAGLATLGGTGGFAIANGEISHRVIDHELGHNLGLYHSGCASGFGGGSEYCDFMDVMGNSGNSMGAWNRERLGWLNGQGTPQLTNVTISGDFSIRALNLQDNALKGLKICKDDGFCYYVTYRNGVGIDANSKPPGVYLHQGPSGSASQGPSQLFRMLPLGEAWREQNVPIWLTVKSCNDTDCVVAVALNSPPALNAPSLLSVN